MADEKVVLIVDDEEEIREILAIHVDSCGFQAIEAEDGQRALEVIRENKVDVIVSDVMMPRMSGIELLRALRAEGCDSPFIFVTAFPSKEATVEALRLGAFDFIEKPFETADITRLVTEAMRVSIEKREIIASTKKDTDECEVEKQILALRSLRFSSSEEEAEELKVDSRLVEMYVSEALPQLVFCDASVKGLLDIEARSWELGYLFRVMQGLKSAAGAIKLARVEKFTQALESCFTAFRVRPGSIEPHVELMTASIEVTREMISIAGSPENLSSRSMEVEEDIYRLVKTIEGESAA